VEGEPDPQHAAVFPARRDAFPRLRTFVEETCARADVPRGDCLRLLLLIEELFANTVTHGHGVDSDAPVRLVLTVTPSAIAVEYEDTARPYDPFASFAAPAEPMDLEDRPIGVLGVTLIMTMAEDVGYVLHEGRNQITFRLGRSG
jgi:serine/threonine-protein kinase RsbW